MFRVISIIFIIGTFPLSLFVTVKMVQVGLLNPFSCFFPPLWALCHCQDFYWYWAPQFFIARSTRGLSYSVLGESKGEERLDRVGAKRDKKQTDFHPHSTLNTFNGSGLFFIIPCMDDIRVVDLRSKYETAEWLKDIITIQSTILSGRSRLTCRPRRSSQRTASLWPSTQFVSSRFTPSRALGFSWGFFVFSWNLVSDEKRCSF